MPPFAFLAHEGHFLLDRKSTICYIKNSVHNLLLSKRDGSSYRLSFLKKSLALWVRSVIKIPTMRRIHLHLPIPLVDRLKRKAKKIGISLAELIRQILISYDAQKMEEKDAPK